MKRKGEWLEIQLPKSVLSEQEPVQHYLLQELAVPPAYYHRLLRNGELMSTGRRVRLKLFQARPSGFESDWKPIDVLYEDDFCLIVNKPAGLKVHPSHPDEISTLANRIAAYYQSTGQQNAVRHIHRLDEWTSGPVLYAKNEYAQYKLDEDMRSHRIERIYTAIVRGVPSTPRGTIDAPIGKDRHHSARRRVSQSGDPAVTHYEIAETYDQAARIRLKLETGRTHQIRVHLSYIGHPIIGDEMYGTQDSRISRQALHGEQLIFHHPLSNEQVELAAPLPEDMTQLIRMLSPLD